MHPYNHLQHIIIYTPLSKYYHNSSTVDYKHSLGISVQYSLIQTAPNSLIQTAPKLRACRTCNNAVFLI